MTGCSARIGRGTIRPAEAPVAAVSCHMVRMAELSPLVSEFATTEEAEAYDRWFRAKVRASLADPRPSVPHDEVMASARAAIEAARQGEKPG